MKNILSAIISIALFTNNILAQQSLTLQQTVDYALQHSPAIKNLRIDREIAASKNFESITKYLPKASASADYRNNLNLAVNQIPAEFFGGQPGDFREVRFGVKYTSTAGIDFTQPILDAAAISEMRYTKSGKQLTEYQIQQAEIELKSTIVKLYHAAQLNTHRVEKAEKTVERNQKIYEDTKVKFDNQNATKTEVSRAYLNLQQSIYQRQLAADALLQSKLALMQNIGMPLKDGIELAEQLPANFNADTALQLAEAQTVFASRVEYKAEQQLATMNKQQLMRVNMQYLPNASFFGYVGGQGFSNEANLFREKWNQVSFIGVRLNVPVFDGLQKAAMAQQQKLNLKKNSNNLKNIEQNVNYQLQTSALSLANTARNLRVQQQNIRLAEDVIHDVKVRYNNAFATYQEVIEAENILKEAETFYFTALYEYLIAEVDWKKANGKL